MFILLPVPNARFVRLLPSIRQMYGTMHFLMCALIIRSHADATLPVLGVLSLQGSRFFH